jgi:hypothetical protein
MEYVKEHGNAEATKRELNEKSQFIPLGSTVTLLLLFAPQTAMLIQASLSQLLALPYRGSPV